MTWSTMLTDIDDTVRKLNLPLIKMDAKRSESDDFLPTDPSGLGSDEIGNKLFEYAAYVSFLDAELGRIDAQRIVIKGYLSNLIDGITLGSKLSKAKAKAQMLSVNPDSMKGELELIKLDALFARVQGLRNGFATRMQALSREISRRKETP